MPAFLYNVQTTVEVYADNQDEADAIMQGAGHPHHNKRTIDNDVMFIDDDGDITKHTCCCYKCEAIKEEVQDV